MEARFTLGRINSVNPAKREARAVITPGLVLDTAGLAWAWFSLNGGEWKRYKVAKAGADDGELRLRFVAGVPMDTVRGLHGAMVAVETAVVLSRGPLWRRVREMVELKAVAEDGTPLGTIVEVYEGPKTGAIKVESTDGTAFTLPVLDGVVLALDEAADAVVLGNGYAAYAVPEESDAD